eukprot:TRINITY_DN1015_c0_g1_i1.p2 TRINITY_DN1015_c0_g1~~TRINITY_DN1015_c0_g1_i1.p2  ORF type:complete len:149 (+),score=19.99 TRINITY_DN1015_c0_g1_i1:33-479(+)
MVWELVLWLFSILTSGYFIFSCVFALMLISDLTSDHVNPSDMASKTNFFWWPDITIFTFNSLLYLLTGHWIVFIIHLPLLAHYWYIYNQQTHLVDETTILQSETTKVFQKRALLRLGFAVLAFCLYLYMLITSAVADLQSNRRTGTVY